ncbi:MAG: hypothetical protein GY909_15820 [Oligoflexia bacterium]|nr:hypothetical protein [Oligoflexia bacterium]
MAEIKLMVIDDQEEYLEKYSSELEGISVSTFKNASSALENLEYLWDGFILDYHIDGSGLKGDEVHALIRKIHKELPIFLISSEEKFAQKIKDPLTFYLPKNVDSKKLSNLIKKVVIKKEQSLSAFEGIWVDMKENSIHLSSRSIKVERPYCIVLNELIKSPYNPINDLKLARCIDKDDPKKGIIRGIFRELKEILVDENVELLYERGLGLELRRKSQTSVDIFRPKKKYNPTDLTSVITFFDVNLDMDNFVLQTLVSKDNTKEVELEEIEALLLKSLMETPKEFMSLRQILRPIPEDKRPLVPGKRLVELNKKLKVNSTIIIHYNSANKEYGLFKQKGK